MREIQFGVSLLEAVLCHVEVEETGILAQGLHLTGSINEGADEKRTIYLVRLFEQSLCSALQNYPYH